ncbi:type I-F CRISPR-associated protein Csy3 [Photorhabdus luminescens]|uniref:type I-F CRISPR-associated protein Csy3 n=1 Tax=Photorhabdus luminescens TaxID=29488 RepID=UPI002240C377|nr:type I-F CRISPR-associated protein Csy3 [Photorhabdus luminescens]MCW7763396.1 type I-F CRISPR-associated protein Csy3 [Photorhabdus luminescens subsp. venezuelensis]
MLESTTKIASILSFERKLLNSDAVMYAGNWDNSEQTEKWQPINIQKRTVVYSKNPLTGEPLERSDLKIDDDVAYLPFDADTLKVVFTLRVIGDLSTPSMCNNLDYQTELARVINGYIAKHGFKALAARYAENLVNGRWLWRNRVGAEDVKVRVDCNRREWLTFNCEDFSLRKFSNNIEGNLAKLAAWIEKGLMGDRQTSFQIEAFVRLDPGQDVFPSQTLVTNNRRIMQKVLYQREGIAALSSHKVGNALRTVDTWYPDAIDMTSKIGPIPADIYGCVETKIYRHPKTKMDFYTLLDKWVLEGKEPEIEQQHYVIATLIRGGVFNDRK